MSTRRVKAFLDAAKTAREHGDHIYIYNHVRSNRVVYSLTPTLEDHAAHKQIPFLGKQTIGTPTIRKDAWAPMAMVEFPNGTQGLAAYKMLREYAVLHLHSWNMGSVNERLKFRGLPTIDVQNDYPGWPQNAAKRHRWFRRKMLGPALQDQKANSIAALAAVMAKQDKRARVDDNLAREENRRNEREIERGHERLREIGKLDRAIRYKEDEESRKQYKYLKVEKMRIKKAMRQPVPYAALQKKYHLKNDSRPAAKRGPLRRLRQRDKPLTTMKGVGIFWADPLDRQFAKQWPETVKHDDFKRQGVVKDAAEDSTSEDAKDGTVKKSNLPGVSRRSKPQRPRTVMERVTQRLKFGA